MFRLNCLVTAVFLALAASSAMADPSGVDLASLAGWDIVLAPDASPAEAYAAAEFRGLVAQAAGVTLPTVTRTDRDDRHVFIGPSRAMAQSRRGFRLLRDGFRSPADRCPQ